MEFNYYEPDPIFSFEGIYSKEEYVKTYLVKADFGPDIPKDVFESYKTAEYLMALAYFYSPIYDEAFWKVLGTYEMAIQFRCNDMGIDLKGSKGWRKSLDKLHKELIQKLGLEHFHYTFDWVREFRNKKAHPDDSAFGGTLYKFHIEMIVKFIKMIFETDISTN